MKLRKTSELGFSLLEAIITVGLLGVVATGFSTISSRGFKAQSRLENDLGKESLAKFFTDSTSCVDTIPAGTCTKGALITINRRLKDGTVVPIAASTGAGTTYGDWTVRGECDSLGRGIVLRSVRLAKGGKLDSTADSHFLPDPLTGKTVKWSDDTASRLLPLSLSLCTGGNTMPMRTEAGQGALADTCDGTLTASPNFQCSTPMYADIAFSQAFKNPPNVLVSISYICDSVCAQGTVDSTIVLAESITSSGFRLVCSGSPALHFCGNDPATFCTGRCNWLAIGN